ncbi:MAG: hypothetical protein JO216_14675 [Hyphomicrobiales bacterium]|nr:hypothetical protein [Hyphomicrobiales bacterium]
MTGWDFLVEFPFEKHTKTTLDKRPTPISCHFQIKTMWSDRSSFKMRLSSAERLAKELKPAFVLVFKINKQKEFIEAYLIHVLDKYLYKILERLRLEHSQKTGTSINKKLISFTAGQVGTRIELNGESLRDAVIQACGPDQHLYAKRKKEQLEELGFGAQPFEMQATLHAGSRESLIDVFLGRKSVRVSNVKGFESRFDIKLPLPEFIGSGTMTITPNSIETCTIDLVEQPLTRPVRFFGEIFVVPELISGKEPLFVIKNNIFELRYSRLAGMKLFIDGAVLSSALLTPTEWHNFLLLSLSLSKGRQSSD